MVPIDEGTSVVLSLKKKKKRRRRRKKKKTGKKGELLKDMGVFFFARPPPLPALASRYINSISLSASANFFFLLSISHSHCLLCSNLSFINPNTHSLLYCPLFSALHSTPHSYSDSFLEFAPHNGDGRDPGCRRYPRYQCLQVSMEDPTRG